MDCWKIAENICMTTINAVIRLIFLGNLHYYIQNDLFQA